VYVCLLNELAFLKAEIFSNQKESREEIFSFFKKKKVEQSGTARAREKMKRKE
jgi:hypothetical protein